MFPALVGLSHFVENSGSGLLSAHFACFPKAAELSLQLTLLPTIF